MGRWLSNPWVWIVIFGLLWQGHMALWHPNVLIIPFLIFDLRHWPPFP